jgi:hypothetical protein
MRILPRLPSEEGTGQASSASDDPATRESALDAMYGAVHHQGDVCDSTLAVIPFLLEIASVPGPPGLAAALGRTGRATAAAVPDLLEMLPQTAALVALGRIGAAASSAVPALEALLDDPAYRVQVGDDIQGNWLRLRAAVALWRSAGDSGVVMPALLAAWQRNPHVRIHVASCLAEMGEAWPSAGVGREAATALLRGELSRRRRHNSTDRTWSTSQVAADLALVDACERALAA